MNKGEIIANKLIKLVENENKSIGFKDIDKFFPYTNENIRGYVDFFNFDNKKVLTVCGSGDQVFNAIALGAKDVTVFDINIVALYHMELKKAIIENYPLDDFIYFYKNEMKQKMYMDVRKYLSDDCKYFWDTLYKSYYQICRFFFGSIGKTYKDYIASFNTYLDEDKYDLLQNNLKSANIRTVCGDLLSIDLKEKYDTMNFSNILNVIRIINGENNSTLDMLNWYKDITNKCFLNHLNANGTILLNYFFNPLTFNSKTYDEIVKFLDENSNYSICKLISSDHFGDDAIHYVLTYKSK